MTREEFEGWTEKHGWLFTGEGPSPQGGKQRTYLTPQGDTVIGVFELTGKFLGTVKVVPMPPPQPQTKVPGFPFLGKD